MVKPITILVADDHPIFRRGLVETIQSDPGLRIVAEAGDGQAALSAIRDLSPEIALLDVHMPKADGIAVARAVRDQQLPTHLIFLTMHDDEETFQEAMDLGVKGYVLKESAVLDVLHAIRAVAAGQHFISPSISGYLVRRREAGQKLREKVPGLESLTPAERRILKLISEDHTSKEIADQLGISPRTVETHRLHICEKLNLHGAHSLLKFAYDNKGKL
jgi:DNA-binding NarL/FixJ family response regulator